MSREVEPSFVIKDPYVKESINTISLYLQWQMVGGVGPGIDSHEFCLRPADLHPHKVGFFLYDCQSCL